jgi:CRP-like cAMP-binding protein
MIRLAPPEAASGDASSARFGKKAMAMEAGIRATGIRASAGAAAHPLADVLACPAQAGALLSGASQFLEVDAAYVVFRQHQECKGLYVVVSGSYARSAERRNTRVALGTSRAGELVELAAALGDGRHTYTLTALTAGSLLLLPLDTLTRAFQMHPPLRMHLLEELAREVSRAYVACCVHRLELRARRLRVRAV